MISTEYSIPKQQDTFSSLVHMEHSSRTDHILGHKSTLSKFKKIEIMPSIFLTTTLWDSKSTTRKRLQKKKPTNKHTTLNRYKQNNKGLKKISIDVFINLEAWPELPENYSSFPSTTYCRGCLFSIVYSGFLCHRLIDHICVSLFLGFLSCSTDLYFCFCDSTLSFFFAFLFFVFAFLSF